MARPSSRLKEFDLQLAHDRRQRAMEARNYGFDDARRRRSRNTLGPQEDVIERRRYRKHVAVTPTCSSTRGILTENVILLMLLAASICGIYRLCIYILNL